MLRALADPNRFRIYLALREKERCVRDLVVSEGLTQSLVSHHLTVLVRAGLVRARRSRGFTMYALDAEGLDRARAATSALLDPDQLGAVARPGGNPNCCPPEVDHGVDLVEADDPVAQAGELAVVVRHE